MGILSKSPKTELVGEISTGWAAGTFSGSVLRTMLRSLRRTFYPTTPTTTGTQVNYNSTRSLYRNDDKSFNLGAGIVRRIINSRVDFIELPFPASGDEIVDEFLEKCIHVYWAGVLSEMIRDATRDADTVIRVRRHNHSNPLVSDNEWEACYLEVVSPERCAIIYKTGGDKREIEVAYIRHEVEEMIEKATELGRTLAMPKTEKKVIIEQITPTDYSYFDQAEGIWRDDLAAPNPWGFVPLREIHNEYDAALAGGQSDLEPAMPFIFALHDVMASALIAHKAHSVPKAKFNVNSLTTFLANNFPDSFESDENGDPDPTKFSGKVDWKGTEIIFMESDEDAGFLEAKSVLGDSKTLADFIIDLIAIASETPRPILMAEQPGEVEDFRAFAQMINRKRRFFEEDLQEICKMVLHINHMTPEKVPMAWDEMLPGDALVKAQALQQRVMADEVLATREVISDRTMRADLKRFIPHMKPNLQEAADAKGNKPVPVIAAPSTSGGGAGPGGKNN